MLEVDAIAERIHSRDPGEASIAAGREVLLRTRGYLDAREDFAIETTLSGVWTRKVIKRAIAQGFFVRLVYICRDSPEQSIQRVHERVAQGGHDVPDEDVRRRFARSLSNLKQILKITHETLVYDNSGVEPILMIEIRTGSVMSKATELPLWAGDLLKRYPAVDCSMQWDFPVTDLSRFSLPANAHHRCFKEPDQKAHRTLFAMKVKNSAAGLLTALLFLFRIPAHAEDAAGDWVGQLNGGFKVRIHIAKANSTYSGYLTNPSGNETNLDEVAADGSHLHFAVTRLNLSYEGTWSDQQEGWTGNLTFQQIYPLTLKRATSADLAPSIHKRPQEAAIAAAPLPYRQKDVAFDNTTAHNRLAGTLTMPQGRGPFPAIVLVSGTGHNTREEDVWGHKVFLVLADALSRKGFAVLRYDKRGVGGSTGDFDTATTADFASDADAAATWLRNQPGVDANHVGILGHSEGGIIAPMVAASDKHVAFVVMIAGPALRGDKLFVLQSAMTAKSYGAPEDYISRRKLFDQRLYDAILAAPSATAAHRAAEDTVAEGVKEKLVDQNEAESLATDDTSIWYRSFLAYDPAPALVRLNVPVLAIYGSLDVQVPAKEDSLAAIEALKNNPAAAVVILPGKNHLMQTAKSGSPNEYNEIEETMSPVGLDLIADWASGLTDRK